MPDSSIREELQVFAVELRKLAYTMPAGHEDRLINLSDRMAQRAGPTAAPHSKAGSTMHRHTRPFTPDGFQLS